MSEWCLIDKFGTPTRTTEAQLLTTKTLPAGYDTVSVSRATLWITFRADPPDGSIRMPATRAAKQRGRERSLLPASGDATQLLRTGTFKGTGHIDNAVLFLLS